MKTNSRLMIRLYLQNDVSKHTFSFDLNNIHLMPDRKN